MGRKPINQEWLGIEKLLSDFEVMAFREGYAFAQKEKAGENNEIVENYNRAIEQSRIARNKLTTMIRLNITT